MKRENDLGQPDRGRTTSAALTVPYLRSVLLYAAQEGKRWGSDHPRLAESIRSTEAEPLEIGGPEGETLENLVEAIRYAAETRVADEIDAEAAYWLEMAIEAAVVRGARAGLPAPSGSVKGEELEAGVAAVADELLAMLVRKLVDSGCAIRGTKAYLDAAQAAEFAAGVGVLASPGEPLEIRTGWIEDRRAGRSYQWRLQRADSRIQITWRRRGEKDFTPAMSLHSGEAGLLSALLQRFA